MGVEGIFLPPDKSEELALSYQGSSQDFIDKATKLMQYSLTSKALSRR